MSFYRMIMIMRRVERSRERRRVEISLIKLAPKIYKTCPNKTFVTNRMPSSLPAQTEVTWLTTIEEGKVKVPFKATFTSGLREW